MKVIETRKLTKVFGQVVAVDGLDLWVEEGSIFGFLGPNGAGKTTTISMLMGFLRPTSGKIFLFGQPFTGTEKELLGRIGFVPEKPGLYENLSATRNLQYLGRLSGLDGKECQARIELVLEQVDLLACKDAWVKTFSHGMKQRLAVAASLLHKPQLLILDEPISGLDPRGIHEIRLLLRQLRDEGTTIFLSSHIVGEIEQVCDTVGIINQGCLLTISPVSSLLEEIVGNVSTLEYQLESTVDGKLLEEIRCLHQVLWAEAQPGLLVVELQRGESKEMGELILRKLLAQGYHVTAFGERRPFLEEAFLSVTAVPEKESEAVGFNSRSEN
jgi:ABC-2 type transport system ATP-binding protein